MTTNKKTHTSEEDIEVLEAHLAGTLKPVAPSKEIVQRLSIRIQKPNRERVTVQLPDLSRTFLVFGGVISGMLLFITIARALYYLTGRRG